MQCAAVEVQDHGDADVCCRARRVCPLSVGWHWLMGANGKGLLRDLVAVLDLWRYAASKYKNDMLKQMLMLQCPTTPALYFKISFLFLEVFLWCKLKNPLVLHQRGAGLKAREQQEVKKEKGCYLTALNVTAIVEIGRCNCCLQLTFKCI